MGCGWPCPRKSSRLRRLGLSAVLATAILLALPAAALAQFPINTVPPSITGTAQVGHTLTCSNGTWLNFPTSFARQWQRNGSALLGETSSTYEVKLEDVNQVITCSVTASNSDGPSPFAATSLPVVPIAAPAAAKPVNLMPPTITGTAHQGQQLACSDGTWLNFPTSYARQWKRDGAAIPGATGATHTVVAADVGRQVTCSVVASNGAGDSVEATSAPVVPTGPAPPGKPANLAPPVITGAAQEGQQLACSDGIWQNSPASYARQWKRDGAAIPGATGATHTVVAADVGHQVTCSVIASNGAGDSGEATSAPVVPTGSAAPVEPVNLAPPVITGVAQEGRDLQCSDGLWLNDPTSHARQWKRDGADIAGATGATHTVVAADVGRQVTCSVVASNGAGASAQATSLPVVPIAADPVSPPAAPPTPTVPGVTPGPGTGGGAPASPPAADRTRPVIRTWSMLRTRFTVGGGTTALAAATRPRAGTAFRLTLSERARVAIFIARTTIGYRQGRRCLVVTKALRLRLARTIRGGTTRSRAVRLRWLLRRRACTILKHLGTLVRTARPGANSVPFSGRLGRRALPVGRYTAAIGAVDAAGNVSMWRRVFFNVVPQPRPTPRRG
ncbi:MAG TPA: hypothetical protein VNB64_08180 [Solirubrobacteraceae bacterium]|nr:hypothetical protein [Solirubrobacteraceae bacterium]